MKGKRLLIAVPASLLIVVASIIAFNWATLAGPVQDSLSKDHRNDGIVVWLYHQFLVQPNILVFDLREVSGSNSMADVGRVLLQTAEAVRDRKFELVILAYQGDGKFVFQGRYFQKLGTEFKHQNPMYTLRTMPENVYTLDGKPAFGRWTGGLIGVLKEQMEDLREFHERWYLSR